MTTTVTDSRPCRGARTSAAGGAVVLIGMFTLFSLVYWNRFLNVPVSGAFLYVAEQILHDKIPYRDFFLIVPPLHALKLAALTTWFGDVLIVARVEALLERTVLALLVYAWLQRYVSVASAVLGTLGGMIIFAGDPADALVSYHHDSVLWAVAAGFAAMVAVSSPTQPRLPWAAISGILAGLCFQTKQTTGAGITLAVPVLAFIAWFGRRDTPGGWRFVAMFALGWSLPNLAVMAWLAREGAVFDFLRSVFLHSSAKGSGLSLWLRPVLQVPVFVAAGIFVGALLMRSRPTVERGQWWIPWFWVTGAFFVVLTAAVALSELSNFAIVRAGMLLQGLVIVGAMGANAAFVVVRGARVVTGTASAVDTGIWMLAGVSFVIAYVLGLSWYAYGPMAIPAVAVFFAFIAEYCRGARRGRQIVVLTAIALVLFAEAHRKYAMPSGWMAWKEPSILRSGVASTLPQLAGLRVSEPTLRVTETVTSLITTYSRPGDAVFVFPYFPLFYVLADRTPPTFAYVHFMDVMPDGLAARDAENLLRNPPAVIVYLDRPEAVMEADEAVYRSGKPSGEREIVAAIRSMADRYDVLTTLALPGTGLPLHVLARKDRISGRGS